MVQATGATESTTATSLTATFKAPTHGGNLLVVSASVFAGPANQITSVTDSAGNTWRKVGAYAVSGQFSDGEMWYASNAASVTSVTANVTYATAIAMAVQEFSGLAANPLEASAGFSNMGTLPDSGVGFPKTPGDLAVGFLAIHAPTRGIGGPAAAYINQAPQVSVVGKGMVGVLSGYAYLPTTGGTNYSAALSTPVYWAAGVALFAAASVQPPPSPSPSPSPSLNPIGPCYLSTPIRAAFYYPWYPENWTQGTTTPATRYNPWPGLYSLDGSAGGFALVRSQIAAMEYAHIQVGIASWWGQGSLTDGRISTLLAAANGTPFCWTLYYEPAITNGSTQIASDLAYITSHYASNPNYLHVNGKPVVFVYSRAVASCADTATWSDANAGQFYLNLQVFGGYTSCLAQPDSWHQYGAAIAADHQAGYSYSISPGFNKFSEASPRLARDPNRWRQNVADMMASNEPWQLITTFNEWMEGSSVENALEWASSSGQGAYLDILHG